MLKMIYAYVRTYLTTSLRFSAQRLFYIDNAFSIGIYTHIYINRHNSLLNVHRLSALLLA